MTTSPPGHRQAVHKAATFVEGDLLDTAILADLFGAHRFDGIFHFASHTLVGESTQKPWLYLRDNIVAASNLLEAAIETRCTRASSCHPPPTSSTIRPKCPSRRMNASFPGSPYGESKAMIERQLHWMHELYGMRYCALRYFNASGAHPNGHIGEDHSPEAHLIPLVLQVPLGQRESITIFGDDYYPPRTAPASARLHFM